MVGLACKGDRQSESLFERFAEAIFDVLVIQWFNEIPSQGSSSLKLVVELTLHWTNSSHLEHQPAEHFIVQWRPVLVGDGL